MKYFISLGFLVRGAVLGVLLTGWLLVSGCAKAILISNPPSKERLRVVSTNADKYTITVADKADYRVPPDGRITIDVPRLPSGDATYLAGIKVASKSSYDVKAILLIKDGRPVRKFSLNDLGGLPLDEQGYRILKVK